MKRLRKAFAALAALVLMLGTNAKAEDLKAGVSYQFSLGGQVLGVRLLELKDGTAVIQTSDNPSYLVAASSEAGAAVNGVGPKDKANKWKLIDNGGGMWNIAHAENAANVLCMGGVGPKGDGKATGVLTLRGNNAGGAGNKDQLWKFLGEAK